MWNVDKAIAALCPIVSSNILPTISKDHEEVLFFVYLDLRWFELPRLVYVCGPPDDLEQADHTAYVLPSLEQTVDRVLGLHALTRNTCCTLHSELAALCTELFLMIGEGSVLDLAPSIGKVISLLGDLEDPHLILPSRLRADVDP